MTILSMQQDQTDFHVMLDKTSLFLTLCTFAFCPGM